MITRRMDNRLILISQTISFLETVHAVIIVFVASDVIDSIEDEISENAKKSRNIHEIFVYFKKYSVTLGECDPL